MYSKSRYLRYRDLLRDLALVSYRENRVYETIVIVLVRKTAIGTFTGFIDNK